MKSLNLAIFISASVALNSATPIEARGGVEREATFVFNKVEVNVLISISKAGNSSTEIGAVEVISESLNYLNLKHPQYRSQPTTKVSVALLDSFGLRPPGWRGFKLI